TAYRLEVQYSLNYSAVTAVFVGRGFSEVDSIFSNLHDQQNGTEAFYSLDLALEPTNPYGLNGSAITVNSFDRRLGTLHVTIKAVDGTPNAGTIDLVVPGEPIEDTNGY